jgi:RNA polymerase sigma factor (sigma-70 family)
MPKRPPFYPNYRATMEPDRQDGRVPAVNVPATAAPPEPLVGLLPLSHDFEIFYADARDALTRAVTMTTGDRDLSVEAVDEAMARAFQRWSHVSRLENPGGWVYRVAVNWATSVLRRRHRPWPFVASAARAVEPPSVAEPDVLRALAELDVRHRAVVVCRYVLGWSEAETAAALSTPAGTVKSRLHRANRQLSSRLAHLRDQKES